MKEEIKKNSYAGPDFTVLETVCPGLLCASETGSTIKDLTEDDTTLGGLFE